jgi:hypothetical protein
MGNRWTGWGIMFLLLAALAPVAGPDGSAAQAQPQPDPWHTYDSVKFGFSIRYPPDWKAQVAFENPAGQPPIIRQRITFRSEQHAQVEIDVWDRDPRLPMEQWFQEVEHITSAVEINAVLSGQDATLRVEPGGCGVPVTYIAVVPFGDKVYKISHANSGDLASLAAYDGMLRSFALWAVDPATRSQAGLPDYWPAAPLTCATNLCPSTCWGECTFAAISEGCCGYHPVPEWQCAKECIGDQPGAFEGNCVWWGAYTRPDVGLLASGNAENWADSVRSTGQLPVDRTPKVGDIVVHPGDSYNHVAYVVWVSADRTSYMMSDMGWCGDCGPIPDETKLRTVDLDNEFIHCQGDPAIPTADWSFTDCPFGWTPGKGFSASQLDGYAWGFNPAADPFLLSPILSVPADEYNNVEIRIFSHAADTLGTIYFTTASSPLFDEAKSVQFGVINDGAWHDIRVNMSNNPNWQGTITRLRVDPIGNGNADGSYDGMGIDRIRFLLFNPTLSERLYLPLVLRSEVESDNLPPSIPAEPWPADGAVDQLPPLTLSWTGGDPDGDEVSYDVYLDAGDGEPQSLACADLASPVCNPGALLPGTGYRWQVVATDEHGAVTMGPVWGLTTAAEGCVEVVVNGGFEIDAAWELPSTAYPARYSTAQARHGSRSMQVGIVETSEDEYSYSSAQQMVTIPAGMDSASLRFWLYTVSDEPEITASLPAPTIAPQEPLADDAQYVKLYSDSGALLWTLWSRRLDGRAWIQFGSYDLSAYAGQAVKLYFGVFNDGDGAATGMFVDEVTLVACPP